MAEKKKGVFFRELFPFTFVVVLWLMHILQGFSHNGLRNLALLPRHTEGLYGIIFHPLLHADFVHLIGNSIPMLVLGLLLFNAYKVIAHRIFFIMYALTGIMVWLFARESWHLGASGLVYGLAAFLFFSGIIRRHIKLMVISMLVVFLYGSMVWGVLPIDPSVSWEGHLFGALSGTMLAWVYRREGPQRQVYWQNEPEEEDEPDTAFEQQPDDIHTPQPPPSPADPVHPLVNISYLYRETNEGRNNQDK
jgi:membrane associated rhomboid family serine protease